MSPYTAHQYEIVLARSVDIKSVLPLEPFSVSFQGSQKSIHVSDSMLRLEGEPTMPRIRYIRQDIADLSTRLAHPYSVLYLDAFVVGMNRGQAVSQ